jgi:hypothetical protein
LSLSLPFSAGGDGADLLGVVVGVGDAVGDASGEEQGGDRAGADEEALALLAGLCLGSWPGVAAGIAWVVGVVSCVSWGALFDVMHPPCLTGTEPSLKLAERFFRNSAGHDREHCAAARRRRPGSRQRR